jgi:hypothetical protein
MAVALVSTAGVVTRTLKFGWLLVLSGIGNTSYARALPSQWAGSYSYQYVMGHASDAPAPAWVFNLIVKSDASCELTWQGYQKDDDIICRASSQGDGLQINFVSFADGGTSDPSGSHSYTPGEKLIEIKPGNLGGRLWTKWWALNKDGVLKDGARFERD